MTGSHIPPTVQKANRARWLIRVLVVLVVTITSMVIYTRNSLQRSCEVNAVEEASALLISQMKRYDDVYQVAVAASRDTAVLPVSVLQQVFMDTKDVAVPACLQTAKAESISYMGTIIRAFDAYIGGETDATIRDLVNQSNTHFNNFLTELKTVKKCAPYCIPQFIRAN